MVSKTSIASFSTGTDIVTKMKLRHFMSRGQYLNSEVDEVGGRRSTVWIIGYEIYQSIFQYMKINV
jgi:hypothetical protein